MSFLRQQSTGGVPHTMASVAWTDGWCHPYPVTRVLLASTLCQHTLRAALTIWNTVNRASWHGCGTDGASTLALWFLSLQFSSVLWDKVSCDSGWPLPHDPPALACWDLGLCLHTWLGSGYLILDHQLIVYRNIFNFYMLIFFFWDRISPWPWIFLPWLPGCILSLPKWPHAYFTFWFHIL